MDGLSPPPLVSAFCNTGIIAEQLWLQSTRPHPLILNSLATCQGSGESNATGRRVTMREKLSEKTGKRWWQTNCLTPPADWAGFKAHLKERGGFGKKVRIQMGKGKWHMLVFS